MKLLFISTFLDSPIHCNRAPYNEQLIDRLSEDMDIQVIRPISWIDWLSYITNRRHKKKSIPRKKSILTSYPILFYIPYLGTRINGFLYFLSIFILSFNKVRNADALYVSWLYPDGYAVMLLAQLFKKPYMVQALGSDINELLYNPATKRRVLSVVKNANAVSVVSQDLKNKLIAQGVIEAKISVIYTGIEVSSFYPIEKNIAEQNLGISNKKRILFVGNLKRAKGINDLLVAAGKLYEKRQDFELCIAGSGPEKAFVDQYIKQYPSLIKYLGVVDHHKLHMWINAASCVCLPSYSEGVPNVLLEAMVCETNIVSTRVGGIPEVIANSDTYLIEAGDTLGLIDSLSSMLDKESFVTKPKSIITSYKHMANLVKNKLLTL